MSNVVVTQGGAQVTHVIQPMRAPQIIQTVSAPILTRENYPVATSRNLGIFLIVGGVLGIVFSIMGMVWDANSADSGYGIWCNLPVIITGILGIVAAANKRTTMITSFLIMSVISLCAVGLMGLLAMIALGVDKDYSTYYWVDNSLRPNRLAADALLLIICLLLGGSLLWSIIIAGNCCQTVPGTTMGTVSTVNHTTVASYPPQQGYIMQTAQPQYHPPPQYGPQANVYQPVQQVPGYPPNQALPPSSYQPPPGYPPNQAPPPSSYQPPPGYQPSGPGYQPYQPNPDPLPANPPPPYAPAYSQDTPAGGAGYDNSGGDYPTK